VSRFSIPSNSSREEIVLRIRCEAFHDPDEVSAGGRNRRDLGYRPPALRDENPIRRETVQQLETLLPEIADVQGLHIRSVHIIVHFRKIVRDRLGRHHGFHAKEFESMVVSVRVDGELIRDGQQVAFIVRVIAVERAECQGMSGGQI
jgi:hypothetical protein